MGYVTWYYYLKLPMQVGGEEDRDTVDIDVMLHVGSEWKPEDDNREISLLKILIIEGNKIIPAIPLDAAGPNDQAVINAVEIWWDDHCGECWNSFIDDTK